jgi:hypothetical protein
VISTVDMFNGADLGIRETWVPLFDRYGVDLVVCGHEHHDERSHPIRGQQPDDTRTPIPVDTRTDLIDTTRGTVHLGDRRRHLGAVEHGVLLARAMPGQSPASARRIRARARNHPST